MGKETIAEFVEDRAAVPLLAELGVDYVQGFAIGEPAPLAQMLEPAGRRDTRPPQARGPVRVTR